MLQLIIKILMRYCAKVRRDFFTCWGKLSSLSKISFSWRLWYLFFFFFFFFFLKFFFLYVFYFFFFFFFFYFFIKFWIFILPLFSKFFNFRIWLLLHFLILFFIPPTPTHFRFSYGSCLPGSPDTLLSKTSFWFRAFF